MINYTMIRLFQKNGRKRSYYISKKSQKRDLCITNPFNNKTIIAKVGKKGKLSKF